jgi:Ca-activated chloride channel family protein
MRKRFTLIALVIAGMSAASGQSLRSLVNEGNDLYKDQKYTDAEVNYRKALEKKKELLEGHFNLGNALYKQGKFGEAAKEYENAIQRSEDARVRADAYYNIGNSLLKGQDYQNAIKAYIEALKRNPEDVEAKHNLSYALRMLHQQQQNQQQQNQQQQNQKQQNQKQQEQQAQRQDRQMSKADAERILEVLKNSEREVQKKLRARQAVRPRGEKDW